jgi:hypothetical protein
MPDKNWGEQRGKDLSGKGYTRLVLQIRSPDGAKLVIKSGGHTAPGARFPASYEASAGVVVAGPDWDTVTIPLPPPITDLSNVPTAVVLAFSEALTPHKCTIQVRGIAFRGPGE